MGKNELFRHESTKDLLNTLEHIAENGLSRGAAFQDFLTMTVCAFAIQTMEEEYLSVAHKYSHGEPGRRPIDLMPKLLGQLVNAMEETKSDVLGDLFKGAITHGERGQFLTPECVTELMAKMLGDGAGETVCDPCCGSGRMLLASAKVNPKRIFIGQDIDHRCAQMTAINLALNGLKGYALWGDSLAAEIQRVYRIGFIVPGSILLEPPEQFVRRFQSQQSVIGRVREASHETHEELEQVITDDAGHYHQGELFE